MKLTVGEFLTFWLAGKLTLAGMMCLVQYLLWMQRMSWFRMVL